MWILIFYKTLHFLWLTNIWCSSLAVCFKLHSTKIRKHSCYNFMTEHFLIRIFFICYNKYPDNKLILLAFFCYWRRWKFSWKANSNLIVGINNKYIVPFYFYELIYMRNLFLQFVKYCIYIQSNWSFPLTFLLDYVCDNIFDFKFKSANWN